MSKYSKDSLSRFSHVICDENEFYRKGSKYLEKKIKKAISERGHCILGLSVTPTHKTIYENLSKTKNDIEWDKVFLFLVDERIVPSSSSEKLYATLLDEWLISNANIPRENLFFPDISLPPDLCVADYSETLGRLLLKGKPDIVTLGFGDDGSIASLFPVLPSRIASTEDLAVHTTTSKQAVKHRISVTLKILSQASSQIFFVKGSSKIKAWMQMCDETAVNIKRWPAQSLLMTKHSVLFTCHPVETAEDEDGDH